MHEIGIVQGALELALQSAQAAGAKEILRVRMRVGVMTGLVPEALQFAFEALREGTIAANSQLEVEVVPAVCWCPECQLEFEARDWNQNCPKCGTCSPDLKRGLEVEVASLEVD